MALTVPLPDAEAAPPDYSPVVAGALSAAAVVLAGNAVLTVVVANVLSLTTEIRFLWSVLPYVALIADEAAFVEATTLSGLLGSVLLVGWLVASAARPSLDRLNRAGRLSCLPMAAALGALQWVRLASAEATSGQPMRWLAVALAVLAAGGALSILMVRREFTSESEAAVEAPESEADDDVTIPLDPVTDAGFRRNLRSKETLR